MGDVLTNLRELSVGFSFYNNKPIDTIKPNYFFESIKNISNTNHLTISNIAKNDISFNPQELDTILNGLKLGEKIKEIFSIKANPKICWTGTETQSDSVVDIIIDDNRFSLKEHSFIIENMGLYKLINLLIGEEKYCRGQLHAFEDFASTELDNWFNTTRDLIKDHLIKTNFNYKCPRYSSELSLNKNDELKYKFEYVGGSPYEKTIPNFSSLTYKSFHNQTDGNIREHVFSKFINKNISKNEKYIDAKSKCSKAAGENIIKLILKKKYYDSKLLKRFFRIEEHGYYYAKTTNSNLEIYKVPSNSEFNVILELNEVNYSVNKSQLNIFTKLINKQTKMEIIFRSEVRYTHGQLNNVPEAKSYIERGDLSLAYSKIL
ncbi:MAG: hypothetical protein IPM32_02780 [Ignavibacteriae bacterium]|nr:hypothetical protein [Ignavibacteriota bacterium]